jgi:hypothetical protein
LLQRGTVLLWSEEFEKFHLQEISLTFPRNPPIIFLRGWFLDTLEGKENPVYRLYGLPEGLIGRSVVEAASKEDLFSRYPQLLKVGDKLEINGCEVRGYAPCDG